METVVFDGVKFASKLEAQLKTEVAEWVRGGGRRPKIASLVFREDKTSLVYTRMKSEAAVRVGIAFDPIFLSINCNISKIEESIQELNNDQNITGVMIQKPTRVIWEKYYTKQGSDKGLIGEDFSAWWHKLTSLLNPNKDLDGLHPSTQKAIVEGSWQKLHCCLPATVVAVLRILDQAEIQTSDLISIIGKSELLGKPLYYVLKKQGYSVELIGARELVRRQKNGEKLLKSDVIISATGQASLVTGLMVKPKVIAIDVGEPKSDFDFGLVSAKVKFITPVPGGVGPVTVVSLLANALDHVRMQTLFSSKY